MPERLQIPWNQPAESISTVTHKVSGWSTWHPLKYKQYIYKGTHSILILHLVENKMNRRWELILHKLPYIWHDSVRGLSNACNFQETRGGVWKKNEENEYNKGRKEKKNKHERWREEGKNSGKKREEQAEMEWVSEWMNEWMNECLNEWMNECLNEWMNECLNEWTTKDTRGKR